MEARTGRAPKAPSPSALEPRLRRANPVAEWQLEGGLSNLFNEQDGKPSSPLSTGKKQSRSLGPLRRLSRRGSSRRLDCTPAAEREILPEFREGPQPTF